MLKIMGLSHIHLYVRDQERTLGFYGAVFGFEEKFRVRDQLFVSDPGDNVWLTFHQSDSEEVGTMGGVAHFGFELAESENFEDALRQIQAAGGRVLERGEHEPGLPYALIADPDGYVFEI